MEILLALSVSAIVLAAIGGVFFSAIRLRERTLALLDKGAPLHQALGLLRRDLQGTLPPGTTLAGDFKLLSSSGGGSSASLMFSTTTGIIREGEPWGDIQEVLWELREPQVRNPAGGRDLVRSVCRNLLSTMPLETDDQRVLSNVRDLGFAFYDGLNWRETWDTSLGDTNLPTAVRVRVRLMEEETVHSQDSEPIEMVIPLETQSRTNQAQSTTEETQ